ncbi:MAG: hypothetical protein ACMV1B_11255, partial [Prevotella sp.]
IEVVKRGIKFKFNYVHNFINTSGDWDYKTIEKDFEFSSLDEALKSRLWTGSVYNTFGCFYSCVHSHFYHF